MKEIIISSNSFVDSDYYCDGKNDEIQLKYAMNLARSLEKSIIIMPGKYVFELKESIKIDAA